MCALCINALHPTTPYTVPTESQENDPFEKIHAVGCKMHISFVVLEDGSITY